MGALVLPDEPSSPCLGTLDDSDASSSQNTLCCFRSWAFAREALRTLSSSAWPLSVSQPEHRVLHQLLCTLPDLALPPFSQAVQLPYSCPEDPLQPAVLPRLPDLANKNTGHLTKFEFQINKFFFFKYKHTPCDIWTYSYYKIIPRLSEIQISLRVLYFIWQPDFPH